MTMQAFLFWVIAGMTAACAIATVVTHNIVRCATWLLFTLAGTSGLFFLIGADLVGAVQLLVYVGGTMILVVFGVMLTAQGPFITMRTSSAEWAVSAGTGIAFFAVLLLAFMTKGVALGPIPSADKNAPLEPVVQYAPEKPMNSDASSSPATMLIGQGFAGVGVGPAHRDPTFRAAPKIKNRTQDEPPLGKPESKELKKDDDKEPAKKDDAADEAKKDAPEQGPQGGGRPVADEVPQGTGVIRTHYLLPFEIISVHLLVVLIGAAYLARAKRRRGGSS